MGRKIPFFIDKGDLFLTKPYKIAKNFNNFFLNFW